MPHESHDLAFVDTPAFVPVVVLGSWCLGACLITVIWHMVVCFRYCCLATTVEKQPATGSGQQTYSVRPVVPTHAKVLEDRIAAVEAK